MVTYGGAHIVDKGRGADAHLALPSFLKVTRVDAATFYATRTWHIASCASSQHVNNTGLCATFAIQYSARSIALAARFVDIGLVLHMVAFAQFAVGGFVLTAP